MHSQTTRHSQHATMKVTAPGGAVHEAQTYSLRGVHLTGYLDLPEQAVGKQGYPGEFAERLTDGAGNTLWQGRAAVASAYRVNEYGDRAAALVLR